MPANTILNASNADDSELEELVRQEIPRYATLRIWGHSLEIQARSGIITLSGHVRTRPARDTAERLVRQVDGVRGVKNELYVDTDLEMAVARALGEDPLTATAFPGILVGSGFGEIFIKGQVASQQTRSAAIQIASQVPGVLRVIDELATPDQPLPAPALTETEEHAE